MSLLRSLFFCFLTFVFLTACGDKNEDSNSSKAKLPKVALIMKSLANPFFVNMAEGAKAHQLDNTDKYELILNGIKNESDLAQQVALVDQMIAMGVNAIVICPADSKALVPALARAKAAGITIVNIDNRLDTKVLSEFNLQIPFIGPDNREGAKLVAQHVLKEFPEGTPVAILEGIPTATNSIQRREGFEAAVVDAKLNLVTVQSASWDTTKAAEITSAILSQYPDLKVILAANDNMALGAASAVNFANLNHKVSIAGFDNIPGIRALLKDGSVQATAEQYGDKFAVFGIEFALDMIAGNATNVDKQTPVDLVTLENLASLEN